MQKITPNLWFNKNAQEALDFYASVFKNFKVNDKSEYGKDSRMPEGTLLTASVEIEGQNFVILNGDVDFPFNESVSFIISCDDQDEVDYYWEKLTSDGGAEVQCGWLKDKFGLSWQVVPKQLGEIMSKDKDGKAMQAMLSMKKLVIADLEKALE